MIITPLGHTEFLVDIANADTENIRILVDAWLSDYAVGDLMERSTKVTLDPEKLSTVDAIFISHSHTDHFDPYTLVDIYQNFSLEKKPLLLLPCTLAYLVPLIREYLGEIDIEILFPGKSFLLKGITITGHMFDQSDITNEDDVMMLSIASDRELIFAEIDTLPDEYDEDVAKALFRIFSRKDYDTRLYLASRNCLDGQLPYYDQSEKRQKSYRAEYIARQKESIKASYQKYEYDEYQDFPNIFTLPGFVRGFIGQGIRYPEIMSPALSQLAIFPLDEIASLESDIAQSFGYEFVQKALLPGRQYRVEHGNIETGRKECSIATLSGVSRGDLIRDESQNKRIYARGPLFPRVLTSDEIRDSLVRILDILNTRFLPYWSASPVASLRSAFIVSPDASYRIGFRILTEGGGEEWGVFQYSLAGTGFQRVSYSSEMRIDEDYFLLDIIDFLDGKQELYSNFWHTLDPKRQYRLWTCLGANLMNHDLIIKKYRLHFERAVSSGTAGEWVEKVLRRIIS